MIRHFTLALAATALGITASLVPASAQGNAPLAPYAGKGNANAKDPAVEKLVAAAQKLDKQLAAKPKDAKLKAKTADAWFQAGYALEYSKAGLPPRARYRGALVHYRKALSLDPNHKKAAAEKKQIEDIYKQMGMPVPQ